MPAARIDPDSPLWDHAASKEKLLDLSKAAIAKASEEAYGAASEDHSLNVEWEATNPFLADYIEKRGDLITGIDDTVRDQIRTAIQAGADAGDTNEQLAARIQEAFAGISDARSVMIARTEALQAYGAASLASYADANIEQAEMYDGDFDEECASVNGRIVSLDEAQALMDDEHPNGTRGVAPYFASNTDSGESADQADEE
ncbi:MAG: phage minor head protein [Candidatus Dormibacteria bacterium]